MNRHWSTISIATDAAWNCRSTTSHRVDGNQPYSKHWPLRYRRCHLLRRAPRRRPKSLYDTSSGCRMSFLGFWVQRLPNKAHGVGTIFERAGLLLNNVLFCTPSSRSAHNGSAAGGKSHLSLTWYTPRHDRPANAGHPASVDNHHKISLLLQVSNLSPPFQGRSHSHFERDLTFPAPLQLPRRKSQTRSVVRGTVEIGAI